MELGHWSVGPIGSGDFNERFIREPKKYGSSSDFSHNARRCTLKVSLDSVADLRPKPADLEGLGFVAAFRRGSSRWANACCDMPEGLCCSLLK